MMLGFFQGQNLSLLEESPLKFLLIEIPIDEYQDHDP